MVNGECWWLILWWCRYWWWWRWLCWWWRRWWQSPAASRNWRCEHSSSSEQHPRDQPDEDEQDEKNDDDNRWRWQWRWLEKSEQLGWHRNLLQPRIEKGGEGVARGKILVGRWSRLGEIKLRSTGWMKPSWEVLEWTWKQNLDHWHVEVDNVVVEPVETFQGLEVLSRYADPAHIVKLEFAVGRYHFKLLSWMNALFSIGLAELHFQAALSIFIASF